MGGGGESSGRGSSVGERCCISVKVLLIIIYKTPVAD